MSEQTAEKFVERIVVVSDLRPGEPKRFDLTDSRADFPELEGFHSFLLRHDRL